MGVDQVPKRYDDAVNLLASWHASGDEIMQEVWSFPDPDRDVVRLVEVSADFPTTGEAVPLSLGKSAEFPFKSSVILLTPDEWEKVQHGEIQLPEAWASSDRVRVWPNATT